jgi:hypothetical protein
MAPNMLAPGAAMSGCSGGNNNDIIILQEICTVLPCFKVNITELQFLWVQLLQSYTFFFIS